MAARALRISDDLTLPVDASTGTFGILATKGAGKSNAGVVMAEEMYDVGIPWVAVDPKGDWWGIRSSSDGKGPGLPIIVFGGRHGDLPLEPTAGALIAELVLTQRISCVVDVSQFTKADTNRFLLAFGQHLFNHADDNEIEPLHVFLEEAHEYLPQRVPGDEAKVVNAWQKIVKQGRFKGIGCTMISQRSSVLNKDVLELIDTLIVLRTMGPRSRKSIAEWVHDQDVDEGLLASLPALKAGEAWVWSPGELGIIQRIQFRRRRTFDSGATPKVGQVRRAPTTIADVDLDVIRDRMADTIERAAANDPKELRAEIARLNAEIASATPERVEVQVETPVVPAAVVLAHEQLTALTIRAHEQMDQILTLAGELDGVTDVIAKAIADVGKIGVPGSKSAGSAPRRPSAPADPHPPGPSSAAPRGIVDHDAINAPRQKILDAIAWHKTVGVDPARRNHVALVAGTTPTSSGFEKNVSALRTAGLVDFPSPGYLCLTAAGEAAARPLATIATTADLIVELTSRLGKPKGRILSVLAGMGKNMSISREGLADMIPVSAESSGYEKNLSSLKSLGFIWYPQRGHVAATDALFIG